MPSCDRGKPIAGKPGPDKADGLLFLCKKDKEVGDPNLAINMRASFRDFHVERALRNSRLSPNCLFPDWKRNCVQTLLPDGNYLSIKSTRLSLIFSFFSGASDFGSRINILSGSIFPDFKMDSFAFIAR